jgi:hypothetical protein
MLPNERREAFWSAVAWLTAFPITRNFRATTPSYSQSGTGILPLRLAPHLFSQPVRRNRERECPTRMNGGIKTRVVAPDALGFPLERR